MLYLQIGFQTSINHKHNEYPNTIFKYLTIYIYLSNYFCLAFMFLILHRVTYMCVYAHIYFILLFQLGYRYIW